jgi:hypothetical protein
VGRCVGGAVGSRTRSARYRYTQQSIRIDCNDDTLRSVQPRWHLRELKCIGVLRVCGSVARSDKHKHKRVPTQVAATLGVRRNMAYKKALELSVVRGPKEK